MLLSFSSFLFSLYFLTFPSPICDFPHSWRTASSTTFSLSPQATPARCVCVAKGSTRKRTRYSRTSARSTCRSMSGINGWPVAVFRILSMRALTLARSVPGSVATRMLPSSFTPTSLLSLRQLFAAIEWSWLTLLWHKVFCARSAEGWTSMK